MPYTPYEDYAKKKAAPQYTPPSAKEQGYLQQIEGLTGPSKGYQDVVSKYSSTLSQPGALAQLGITGDMVKDFAGKMFQAPTKWKQQETARRQKLYGRELALTGNKALSSVMGSGGAGSSGAGFAATTFADTAARGRSDIAAQVGREARERRLQNMGIGMDAMTKYAGQYGSEQDRLLSGLQTEAGMERDMGQMTKEDLYKLFGAENAERLTKMLHEKDIYSILQGQGNKGSSVLDIIGMLGSAALLA